MEVKNTIECQVVMQPQKYKKLKPNDVVIGGNGAMNFWTTNSGEIPNAMPQHVYFISDEEIEEGAHMMLNNEHPQGRIRKCYWLLNASNEVTDLEAEDSLYIDPKDAEGWGFCRRREVKKIVASTDQSLGLPSIPIEWIRTKYVPSSGSIKEVKLELEHISPMSEELKGNWVGKDVVRITNNNEVVIINEGEQSVVDELNIKEQSIGRIQRNSQSTPVVHIPLDVDDKVMLETLKNKKDFLENLKVDSKHSDVTRVELIDHTPNAKNYGRAYTNYSVKEVEISFQDNGKTLKIFVK